MNKSIIDAFAHVTHMQEILQQIMKLVEAIIVVEREILEISLGRIIVILSITTIYFNIPARDYALSLAHPTFLPARILSSAKNKEQTRRR